MDDMASTSATSAKPEAQLLQLYTLTPTLERGPAACAEGQYTYSRQRKAKNDGNNNGQAKRVRPQDYSWLQGANDTPASDARGAQQSIQGLFWSGLQPDCSEDHRCDTSPVGESLESEGLSATLVR